MTEQEAAERANAAAQQAGYAACRDLSADQCVSDSCLEQFGATKKCWKP